MLKEDEETRLVEFPEGARIWESKTLGYFLLVTPPTPWSCLGHHKGGEKEKLNTPWNFLPEVQQEAT